MSSPAQPNEVSAAFWSELPSGRPADLSVADAIALQLVAGIAAGRAAFSDFALDDTVFARHLARALTTADLAPTALSTLAFPDLYLACACLAGVAEAIATLQTAAENTIRASIARLLPAADVSEAQQRLMEQLLVGTSTSPAKLQTYAGRAPLDRWLAVAAQNAALMWLREERAHRRVHERAAAESFAPSRTDPEIGFLKAKYRGEFQRALADALGRLPSRERLALRLYLVNGVTMERIGKMLSINQSTASRLLAAARRALLHDIKRSLRERLRLSSGELATLAGMVASQLDLSLSKVLAPR